jgi:hypothetical protein
LGNTQLKFFEGVFRRVVSHLVSPTLSWAAQNGLSDGRAATFSPILHPANLE